MSIQAILQALGMMGGGTGMSVPGLSPGGLEGSGGLAALEAAGVPAAAMGATATPRPVAGGMNPMMGQMLAGLAGEQQQPQRQMPQSLPVASMPGRPTQPMMPGMLLPRR